MALEAKNFVLARPHVTVWNPMVIDHELTRVITETTTIPNQERVRAMRSLRQINSHKKLIALRTEAFTKFNARTWPCEFRGFRIANVVVVPELRDIIADIQPRFQKALDAFLCEYEDARRLGVISPIWPSANAVRNKFYCEAQFLPIPAYREWQTWFMNMRAMHLEYFRQRILEALDDAVRRLTVKGGKRKTVARVLANALKMAADIELPPELQKIVQEVDTVANDAKHAPEQQLSKIDMLAARVRAIAQ